MRVSLSPDAMSAIKLSSPCKRDSTSQRPEPDDGAAVDAIQSDGSESMEAVECPPEIYCTTPNDVSGYSMDERFNQFHYLATLLPIRRSLVRLKAPIVGYTTNKRQRGNWWERQQRRNNNPI